jgi:hypothetical protein
VGHNRTLAGTEIEILVSTFEEFPNMRAFVPLLALIGFGRSFVVSVGAGIG